jgi:hypothetical protein
MKGYVDIYMMVVGAIAVIITAIIFQLLPYEHIWKTIISISCGTMIIGIGIVVRSRFESKD